MSVCVRARVLFRFFFVFCDVKRAREGAQMEDTGGLIEINGVEARRLKWEKAKRAKYGDTLRNDIRLDKMPH